MALVATCAGWTLKNPASAVVSNRKVCRLLIRGQYLLRMDFIPGITDTRRAISFVNLTYSVVVPGQPTLASLILMIFAGMAPAGFQMGRLYLILLTWMDVTHSGSIASSVPAAPVRQPGSALRRWRAGCHRGYPSSPPRGSPLFRSPTWLQGRRTRVYTPR